MKQGMTRGARCGGGPLLSPREEGVLRLVVEAHVREARPIGSLRLVRSSGLALSPSTVRSVMLSLAERRLLGRRHLSAGSEPTGKGYRYYVDHLMTEEEPSLRARRILEERLRQDIADKSALLANLAHFVGVVSRQLGLALVAHLGSVRITTVELFSLSPRRVVAVLGLEGETVRTLVLQLDRDLSDADVSRARALLAEGMLGRDLVEARRVLDEHIRPALGRYGQELQALGAQLPQLLVDEPTVDLFIGPPGELAMQAEFAEGGRLRELLRLLEEERPIVRTLASPPRSEGVSVRIGAETGERGMEEMSVVSATVDGERGYVVLGLLGPMRMDYPRMISLMGWLKGRLKEVL